MNVTRIAFTDVGKVELESVSCPLPTANQVQVQLSVSAISSGTERANLSGDPNISIYGAPDTSFPRHCGYSSSGIVIAVGEKVEDLKVGDRVAVGGSTHCQVVNVPRKNVCLLPDGVSFEAAALFYIATFTLGAIRKCRIELGEPVLVMGLGILGLLAIPLLRNVGAAPIVVADPIEKKRQQALSFGADYALDPTSADFSDQVKKLTGGGVAAAIEVTGVGAALDRVLDCIKPLGRVALLGCTRNKDFTIDYYRKVHGPGISLIGAHTMARPSTESSQGLWTSGDDLRALATLSACGRLNLQDFVQEIHSPRDAREVYNRLLNEPGFPIVEFDWRKL